MHKKERHHPTIVDPRTCRAGCTCGREHPTPRTTLFSGEDALRIMAEDCRAVYGKSPVLLLSDPETDIVAGRALREELHKNEV